MLKTKEKETTKKRGRGRPRKKPKELPKFKSDSEIRKYLIEEGFIDEISDIILLDFEFGNK